MLGVVGVMCAWWCVRGVVCAWCGVVCAWCGVCVVWCMRGVVCTWCVVVSDRSGEAMVSLNIIRRIIKCCVSAAFQEANKVKLLKLKLLLFNKMCS